MTFSAVLKNVRCFNEVQKGKISGKSKNLFPPKSSFESFLRDWIDCGREERMLLLRFKWFKLINFENSFGITVKSQKDKSKKVTIEISVDVIEKLMVFS